MDHLVPEVQKKLDPEPEITSLHEPIYLLQLEERVGTSISRSSASSSFKLHSYQKFKILGIGLGARQLRALQQGGADKLQELPK